MAENQFPSEVIDLPSEGKLYPEGSPLREGKLELKYMTAKEEHILTSQNLIKKGLVIDQLLNSLIINHGITTKDLYLGDKNAIMVAARILAYGPEYRVSIDDNFDTSFLIEVKSFDISSLLDFIFCFFTLTFLAVFLYSNLASFNSSSASINSES